MRLRRLYRHARALVLLPILASCATSCHLAEPALLEVPLAPVWRVTSGENTVYLGGTVHLLRAQDLPPPPAFEKGFAAADAVYFETEIDRLLSPSMLGYLMTEGVYPPGRTLRDDLNPEAWAVVEQYCREAELSVAMMERFKPWMFVMNVTSLELQKIGVAEQGIDFIYAMRAREAGKALGSLERFEDHLEYLTHLAAGNESELIISSIAELHRLEDMFAEAIDGWRAGDLEQIEASLVREIREGAPEIYDVLIVERNHKWLPQIEAMLRTEPVELVLVGVGHMPGEDGLITQLRARGYTVEQLPAEPAAAPEGG